MFRKVYVLLTEFPTLQVILRTFFNLEMQQFLATQKGKVFSNFVYRVGNTDIYVSLVHHQQEVEGTITELHVA